jgi:hypothetical protein
VAVPEFILTGAAGAALVDYEELQAQTWGRAVCAAHQTRLLEGDCKLSFT